jgi:hypothetical protein
MLESHLESGGPRSSESAVFLLGAPRSGTSLIYKALCMHPEAVWISNWVRTYPAAPVVAAANRLSRRFPEIRRRVWFGNDSNAYVYGQHRPLWERAFPMPVEGERIFARLDAEIDDRHDPTEAWVSQVDRARDLRSTVRSIRRFAGGSTFVNKRIGNNRRIAQLMRAFPDARFVDLIRDGRAVAYSLSRVDWWPDTVPWWHHQSPRAWEAEGEDGWELCAREWVEEVQAIESGLRLVPQGQSLRLSYEELIRSPVESLRSVATFAGLPVTGDWVDRVARLDFPDRNETWPQRLTPTAVRTIEEIQCEALTRYGYAV